MLLGRPPVPRLGDGVGLPQFLGGPVYARRGAGRRRGRAVRALRRVRKASVEPEAEWEREAEVGKKPEAKNPVDRHRRRYQPILPSTVLPPTSIPRFGAQPGAYNEGEKVRDGG